MKNTDYKKEIKKLTGTTEPASLEFCKAFLDRLNNVDYEKCPKKFQGGDSEDYWAWGKALSMDMESAEEFVYAHDCFGNDEEIRSSDFINQIENYQ